MLTSRSWILAEAINTKILTKNRPDSPHSHPDSPHSHHDSPHSQLDSPRSLPDSPRSHPYSPRCHHSPHSVPQFPIPAFTDSKKSTSICDYIHFYDWDSLLTTLSTLFRKATLKMHFLETTLTTLIYIKNSFITDYADNDDLEDNIKNGFVIEFADYPVFNTKWEMISSLTALTTLICKTTLKIIWSWTTLIEHFKQTRYLLGRIIWVLGPLSVLGPARVLDPPMVLGPHWVLDPYRVLGPHSVLGPGSRFSCMPFKHVFKSEIFFELFEDMYCRLVISRDYTTQKHELRVSFKVL